MMLAKQNAIAIALAATPCLADAVYTGSGMAADPFGNQVPYSIVVTLPTPAPTYYFDSEAGVDTNDCRSVAKSCKTIAKANSLPYGAGFQALFKGSFVGNIAITPTQVPTLGDPAHPVIIGSIDPSNRATITSAAGGETGVVSIDGVSGVTIDGLILRAPQPANVATMPRGGVFIRNSSAAAMSTITVRNSDIGGIAYFAVHNDWGAEIMLEGWPSSGGSISGLLFENNDLHGLAGVNSVDDSGIAGFGGQSISNVTVRGNRINNIGGGPVGLAYNTAFPPMGDGIQANAWTNVLIEQNIVTDMGANFSGCGGPAGILTANVDTAIIQFNEVARVQPVPWNGSCDFIAFDADIHSTNTIWQYNYSHDNFNSGFYLFDPSGGWDNNTVRFNVSQNDSWGGYLGFGAITISTGGSPKVYVYNNVTFNNQVYTGQQYQNPGQGGVSLSIPNNGNVGGVIANNLFITSVDIGGGCPSVFARQYTAGWAPTVVITNNEFKCLSGTRYNNIWAQVQYSDMPSMAAASGKFQNSLTVDPKIGLGNIGPNGYKLTTGSPMLNAGIDLTAAPYSLNVGTQDYFGNAPSRNIGADSGAH
jgi:hypothetical protein